MSEQEKPKIVTEADTTPPPTTAPQVFISHDSRDADLAEAFSKLVKSISGSMIRTFWSSDKRGTDGFDFGEDWYKGLLSKLQTTSDCVCLFTERSLGRPWILFEAGVAKAKLTTPVIGIALGVPLSRVATGPFYQFHNLDDTEAELTKLMNQLARRVPGLEPDADVVKAQVQAFKTTEALILKNAATTGGKRPAPETTEESAVAKLVEEMKSLPSRIAERLTEDGESSRGRRRRRFHPMMFEDMMRMSGEPGDPVAILMVASMLREDAPWLYELALEVYRAVKSEDTESIQREMERLRHLSHMMMEGPWMRDFGDKESHMIAMEFPRMLDHMLRRTVEQRRIAEVKKPPPREKLVKPELLL